MASKSKTEPAAMPQKAHRQPEPATGFLSLSREIRQMILYESFEDAFKQDIDFNTNHAIIHYQFNFSPCHQTVSAHNTGKWASTLASTNSIVKDDLRFVLNRRLDELDKEYQTMELGPGKWAADFLAEPNVVRSESEQRWVRGLQHSLVIWSMAKFERWWELSRVQWNGRECNQELRAKNKEAICLANCPCS